MENEERCIRCAPLCSRRGRKYLFLLVSIHILLIWLVYKKKEMFPAFSTNTIHIAPHSVSKPLSDVSIFHMPLLDSKDMAPFYIEVSSNMWCLKLGTDANLSKQNKKCICQAQWFGLDCGIPSSVWKSDFLLEGKNAKIKLMRREKPRRIVFSLIFEDTFDLLEICIQNLFDVVDLFLIGEERNQTTSSIIQLSGRLLPKYTGKIMMFNVSKDDGQGSEKERIIQMFEQLWTIGWSKLSDFRPDDIMIFAHVSSLISSDALLFLKLYDGFPEPFFFNLRPVIFTFSKVLELRASNISLVPFQPLGFTLQFISTLCDFSISKCLQQKCTKDKHLIEDYEKQHWMIKEWNIGSSNFPSGLQCNFCCDSNCVFKLAQEKKWLQTLSMSLFIDTKNLNITAIEKIMKMEKFVTNHISFNTVSDCCPRLISIASHYTYLLN